MHNELTIYDVIGEDFFGEGITAKSVKAEFDGFADTSLPLHVRVNSPGGDVMDGLAIRTLLASYPGDVTAFVDGGAISSASVIILGADEIVMAEGSLLMIHDPWTITVGNQQEHVDTSTTLGVHADNIAKLYAGKSGKPADEMRDLMLAETWLDAEAAVDIGLADSVASSTVSAKLVVPTAFCYKHAPDSTNPEHKMLPSSEYRNIAAMKCRLALTRAQLGLR